MSVYNLTSINKGRTSPLRPDLPEAHFRRSIKRNFWLTEVGTYAAETRARELRSHAVSEFLENLVRKISAGVKRATSGVASWLSSAGRAIAARRTYEVLSRLSDRQLADIGLTRHEIPAVAFGDHRRAKTDKTYAAVDRTELVDLNIRKAA